MSALLGGEGAGLGPLLAVVIRYSCGQAILVVLYGIRLSGDFLLTLRVCSLF